MGNFLEGVEDCSTRIVFRMVGLTDFLLHSDYRSNGFEIRPRSIPNDEDGGRGEMSRQWHFKLDAWGC